MMLEVGAESISRIIYNTYIALYNKIILCDDVTKIAS